MGGGEVGTQVLANQQCIPVRYLALVVIGAHQEPVQIGPALVPAAGVQASDVA